MLLGSHVSYICWAANRTLRYRPMQYVSEKPSSKINTSESQYEKKTRDSCLCDAVPRMGGRVHDATAYVPPSPGDSGGFPLCSPACHTFYMLALGWAGRTRIGFILTHSPCWCSHAPRLGGRLAVLKRSKDDRVQCAIRQSSPLRRKSSQKSSDDSAKARPELSSCRTFGERKVRDVAGCSRAGIEYTRSRRGSRRVRVAGCSRAAIEYTTPPVSPVRFRP